MTFKKISFILPILIYVSITEAAVIGEASFSGSEFIETFGVSPDPISGSSFTVNDITLSDSNLDILSAGILFDNYAGASLDNAVRDYNQDAYLTIDFAGLGYDIYMDGSGINRVGGLISAGGDPSSQWQVTIYDTSLNIIESANFSQPAIDDAVFFGFESNNDIARITIDKVAGNSLSYTFIDDIRYETVVPIPAAVWLFGSGLIGLIGLARRKKA